ncbi:MAG TPA: nuclear transport factor 2 family protein [Thermoleophilaceae bacterium]|nr:nuclear transport factor 2 family protein [Thermoleophilaceae bacterium]
MSEEPVDLVRGAFFSEGVDLIEVLESGEFRRAVRTDALADDAEVVFVTPSGPQALFHGPGGFVEGWRDWLAPWASYTVTVEELIDAGGGKILALARLSGETKRDHVEIEHPAAAVLEVKGGKIARVEFHLDRDEAREAAGLK